MNFVLFEAFLILGSLALMAAPSEENQTVVILMGPPGSGKGTQAKLIHSKLGIPHISTGDLLREQVRNETEIGKQVKEMMESGKLVPDALIFDLLFERVAKPDASKGYLLDGFPRNIPQAEELDRRLGSNVRQIVINLDVSDDVIIKRISGRMSCPDCGAVYNTYFEPPEEEGKCDECGAELVQREDDREEVVKERLKVYNEQTAPLKDYYQRKGTLINIDGEQSPDVISSKVLERI